MNLEDLDKNNIPQHVAIIMDGNGRWAQQQMQRRLFGHHQGLKAAHRAVEAAVMAGVKYLTLYTFSTENWNRPQEEVNGLMDLLITAVLEETKTLMDNDVRLEMIGEMDRIPKRSREKLQACMDQTAHNKTMTLILALSYSSRWETAKALQQICQEGAEGKLSPAEINEDTLRNYLATSQYPDPDLLIRTGGEFRISNFLLWQMAYTEFVFSDLLWPEFQHEDLYQAISEYQHRQRRFGKTGAQVMKKG